MNDATQQKPSVTFCITELDVGGAEKALVRVVIGLQSRGWRVRVISLRDAGEMSAELSAADVLVTALHCGGFADLRNYFRLRKELREHPTDLLMCFLHQANFYGRLAARFSGGPIPLSGVRVADRRKSVILTDRWTRCCVAKYIAVSQHVADTHAELCRIDAEKMLVIPNGVDLPNPAVLPTSNPGAGNVLLSVGRLRPQKDPMCLLDAFSRLPEPLRSQTTLNFVGEGPLREPLSREIQQRGLDKQVNLPGHSDDVPELMRQATLLVLSSRWEGMPNVVLEAMANGLPVVATDVDGVRELVTPGRTGWLAPAQDPSSLAEAIAEALAGPERRAEIAKSAQTLVAESFTWESVLQQYEDVLLSMLRRA